MDKYKVLKHYFGYTSFRGGQGELIDSVMMGKDVLGIMPTGGGKSICYQVPALMMTGMTLVISPLISLMKDQVSALKNAGIPAAFINSTLTTSQLKKVYENLQNGLYKILYIAPERLMTDGFERLASKLDISMVAVDEAHCVSQWGNDFRPSYLRIAEFIKTLPERPVLSAFTATATERVRLDIEEKLRMSAPFRVVTGFDRPNLKFSIEQPTSKSEYILKFLKSHGNESGIIYCMTRGNVEKICDFLCDRGFLATRYHAGLDTDERQKNQDDFVFDRKPIMVATNAFGMGIDKSNVSYVIHYNMPLSLEAYYQEAGRAGRDGESAQCILLYSPNDIYTAKTLIEHIGEDSDREEHEKATLRQLEYNRLNVMIDYCKTTKCLRGNILDYFGQPHSDRCDNCGNCNTNFKKKDVTVESQKILSCIKRVYDRLGYYVGEGIIVRVLCGSEEKRIMQLELNTISTYGIMSDTARDEVGAVIRRLIDLGYIYRDEEFSTLKFTDKSADVLQGRERVTLEYKEAPPKETKKKNKTAKQIIDADSELYERLRKLRFEIAKEQNLPAFVIFSNATLTDMSAKKPTNVDEFTEVSGVGQVKAEQYGKAFIKEIRDYLGCTE